MSFLGFIGLITIMIATLQFIYYLLQKLLPRKSLSEKYGLNTWAVITGASDGIGKGFAQVLAKSGFKIILIARNPKKLEGVKEEILKASPNSEVKIVIADFKKSLEPGFYDKIYNQIKNLDISILINNVGVGNTGFFHKIDNEKINDIMSVNIFPQYFMTKKLIHILLNRLQASKNLRSAIVNVSSINGTRAFPYVCMYSSSKAYNDMFSRCLNVEFKNRIDILSLRPGYVTSQMTYRKEVGLDTISPEDCAEGCLRDLGRKSYTFGHYKHEVVGNFASMVPEWLLMNVMKIAGPKVARDIEIKEKKFQDSLKGEQ